MASITITALYDETYLRVKLIRACYQCSRWFLIELPSISSSASFTSQQVLVLTMMQVFSLMFTLLVFKFMHFYHLIQSNKSKLLREHLRYTPITNSLQENEDDA